MEMENLIKLKNILNKIVNDDICILPISRNEIEVGKSYKLTCFGKINGKTLDAVLNDDYNDDYILRFLNKYPNKITEKEITMYNTNSKNQLNLIYNGEKFVYYYFK